MKWDVWKLILSRKIRLASQTLGGGSIRAKYAQLWPKKETNFTKTDEHRLKMLRQIGKSELERCTDGRKPTEKYLHSWTKFADSDGCLLHQRSSDIRTQAHDRVSLGSFERQYSFNRCIQFHCDLRFTRKEHQKTRRKKTFHDILVWYEKQCSGQGAPTGRLMVVGSSSSTAECG